MLQTSRFWRKRHVQIQSQREPELAFADKGSVMLTPASAQAISPSTQLVIPRGHGCKLYAVRCWMSTLRRLAGPACMPSTCGRLPAVFPHIRRHLGASWETGVGLWTAGHCCRQREGPCPHWQCIVRLIILGWPCAHLQPDQASSEFSHGFITECIAALIGRDLAQLLPTQQLRTWPSFLSSFPRFFL